MGQTIEINHKHSTLWHPPYQTTRAPIGRIASAFAPSPREHRELARALAAVLEGEVRFDDGSRVLYAADASSYRQAPIRVVVLKSGDEVVVAVDLCRGHGGAIVQRGRRTSRAR